MVRLVVVMLGSSVLFPVRTAGHHCSLLGRGQIIEDIVWSTCEVLAVLLYIGLTFQPHPRNKIRGVKRVLVHVCLKDTVGVRKNAKTKNDQNNCCWVPYANCDS